jgi:hypothetical protein
VSPHDQEGDDWAGYVDFFRPDGTLLASVPVDGPADLLRVALSSDGRLLALSPERRTNSRPALASLPDPAPPRQAGHSSSTTRVNWVRRARCRASASPPTVAPWRLACRMGR